jgi:hypothetical protein
MQTHARRWLVTGFALIGVVSMLGAQQPASIAGKWDGSVDTDQGTMEIQLAITVSDGKANGTITTAHGDITISNGTLVNDRWRLPFSGHGMKGEIVGTLKGDTFEGVWDNSPTATGSIKLRRTK